MIKKLIIIRPLTAHWGYRSRVGNSEIIDADTLPLLLLKLVKNFASSFLGNSSRFRILSHASLPFDNPRKPSCLSASDKEKIQFIMVRNQFWEILQLYLMLVPTNRFLKELGNFLASNV